LPKKPEVQSRPGSKPFSCAQAAKERNLVQQGSVTRRPPAPAFGYACFIIIATDQPTFMVNRGAAMSSAQGGSEADVGVIEKA